MGAVVLAGCGGGDDGDTTTSGDTAAPTTVLDTAATDTAPATTAGSITTTTLGAVGGSQPAGDLFDQAGVLTGIETTVGGDTFDLAQLRGTDLVVWFWAPW